MRRRVPSMRFLLLVMVMSTALAPAGARAVPAAPTALGTAAAASTDYAIEEIAPGVHAVIRREPLGLANHSNTVIIVNDTDVVVVDSPFTRQATREVLDVVRGLTDRPVAFVINTHWHDDHTFGNQVWREAFPNVTFIATAGTRADMAGVGVENRKDQVEGGPGALEAIKGAIAKGESLDGSPMSDDERAAFTSSVRIFEQYLSEVPDFKLTLPELTFDDRLTLIRGGRTIEIFHPGAGVTAGDAVVYLPADGILVAGDLVDAPFPYAYRSRPTEWIATLDTLAALKPRLDRAGARTGPGRHGAVADAAADALVDPAAGGRGGEQGAADRGGAEERPARRVRGAADRRQQDADLPLPQLLQRSGHRRRVPGADRRALIPAWLETTTPPAMNRGRFACSTGDVGDYHSRR